MEAQIDCLGDKLSNSDQVGDTLARYKTPRMSQAMTSDPVGNVFCGAENALNVIVMIVAASAAINP